MLVTKVLRLTWTFSESIFRVWTEMQLLTVGRWWSGTSRTRWTGWDETILPARRTTWYILSSFVLSLLPRQHFKAYIYMTVMGSFLRIVSSTYGSSAALTWRPWRRTLLRESVQRSITFLRNMCAGSARLTSLCLKSATSQVRDGKQNVRKNKLFEINPVVGKRCM